MAIEVKMKNSELILLTKETYCSDDIQVNAELQEKTITKNGEVIPDSDYVGLGKVIVNVPTTSDSTSNPVPEDVATAEEMTALLTADNVGKVYRFTGETDDTYTNGDLYEVVSG